MNTFVDESSLRAVQLREIAVSNMVSIEALVKVLLEKWLVSRDELLDAVAFVEQDMVGKVRAGNVEQWRHDSL